MTQYGSNFSERQKHPNTGEIIFENYCKEKGYKFYRFGFDEKNNQINNYFDLNPMLRNLPDYVVDKGDGLYIVAVKGSVNIKQSEYKMIPMFIEWYSSKKAPLVYCFCMHDKIKTYYADKVIELYEQSYDKKWDDGKIYRSLKL